MQFSSQAILAPKFSASATGEVTDYPGEFRCFGARIWQLVDGEALVAELVVMDGDFPSR